jgi:hypothetical protein
MTDEPQVPAPAEAIQRLTQRPRQPLDLPAAATAVAAVTRHVAVPAAGADGSAASDTAGVSADDLLDALVVLHWIQDQLTGIEPSLIGAARRAGVSWRTLARALGVASRQAAERRYLRLTPPGVGQADTREGRVRAERDRRAGSKAINRWANANTADLRRLAGQITALTDLQPNAADDIALLHQALADPDATALPALLAQARRHLNAHPHLADQIDAVETHTDQIRRDTTELRDGSTRKATIQRGAVADADR